MLTCHQPMFAVCLDAVGCVGRKSSL